jgi:hypothetical protein
MHSVRRVVPRPDYTRFEADLLEAGIPVRRIRRTVSELDEHFDDIVVRARATGLPLTEAEEVALRDLGDLVQVAAAMRSRPELRGWAYRFPYLALVVYPLSWVALLPAVPVVAGAAHAPQIARWAASVLLSGVVTASMLLVLQLAIILN